MTNSDFSASGLEAVRPVRPFSLAAFMLVLLAVHVTGCAESDDRDQKRNPAAQSDSLAHRVVADYLRLSYQGASLRSTHPLNDSLLALTGGKGAGGPVTLVDTFYLKPAPVAEAGSSHTFSVDIPTALTVTRVWKTSDPQNDQTLQIQVKGKTVARPPRIVGWPALRKHLLRVEPDSGAAIAERIRERWTNLTEKRAGV